MTKGQTSKMEARKKKNKAAAAQRRQRPLPAGWIQGDFLPSTVTEGDLLELVEHGMLMHKSWRLPADDEVEPAPREGERVLLLSHVHRGPEDSTQTNVVGILEEKVTSWVLQITGPCENPKGARRVTPYSADNPPPNQAWTNWFSPVPNGNPEEEEEEGSQEGSVESAEYVFDSGESEEEDSEEEDEERDSPPPRPEHRSKHRHEPAAPSAPPASSSALPAAPVAPSVRGTKRARDAAAEPAGQSSRAPKPSGPKPRKALPRMRVAIPVTSTVATSATSPARQGDDPMDTDNVVSSQSGAICLDEDDQGRADPTVDPILEPVSEAAPPAATPAADAPPTEAPPPTEPVPVGEEPTGANLGMPQELPTIPGSSNAEFSIRCVLEEQVGAAKGAMVQAELMAGEAKRVYDSVAALYERSLELRDDIRKTCEMGTAYEALRAERNQYAGELEAAMLAMAGMKDALEVREKS
ncbi:hypothetical protein ZWY2020_000117 [Hordeum vulgare]|nr:hypothetical protein ZWY2020_000117 [Hordeum vulgare]